MLRESRISGLISHAGILIPFRSRPQRSFDTNPAVVAIRAVKIALAPVGKALLFFNLPALR
jgi:hypothetical protein